MKNVSTYYSAWDWLPWTIIVFTVIVCMISTLPVNVILAITLTMVLVLIEVAAFLSTYYQISGGYLIVHSSYKVKKYPIDKIKEIKPTNSWLASPAASLTKRLEITFTDKTILKNSIPLIISPARQTDFIQQLLSINPDIKH